MRQVNWKRLCSGLAIALVLVVLLSCGLLNALNYHTPLYSGKPASQWRDDLMSGDASRSNHARQIIASEVLPQLSGEAQSTNSDSSLTVAVVEQLNELPFIHVRWASAAARRSEAVVEIGNFGQMATNSVPLLIRLVRGSESGLHVAAVTALGQIHSDAAVVVPLLIECLKNEELADCAAESLGEYGSLAREAIPQLLPLLSARDKEIRRGATLAIPKIDREAATHYGITDQQIKMLMLDPAVYDQIAARKAELRKKKAAASSLSSGH